MTELVQVVKLSSAGEEVISYPGEIIWRSPGSVRVEAEFSRDAVQVGKLILERGDRFIETYYDDRWYNVFEVRDRQSGEIKGWYCNIARPAVIGRDEIRQQDLELDFVVYPDGSFQTFDMAEFIELDLDEPDRSRALAALAELQQLLNDREGPFSTLA